ncbi:hypothetical protein INT43_006305 [Umbelopsis isabellina]|uniref:ARM repeat-containing protein n=1 Tax=Mortierella isabellina TaxID=91625 RepID=A0A8H7Q0Y2_MORIS|nr:hypothetical protein INT43_006305 [Umbelopsis isabellina]
MESQALDHDLQRIQKFQAFDEQMKRLDLQQHQEDMDLLKSTTLGPISPPNNPSSKASPSSRSLPTSRRNSENEDDPDVLDFGNKLKLSDNEQSNVQFSLRKSPGRLLNKLPNRSMTADVSNLQHTGYKPVSNAGVNTSSHATSAFSGSFLFDDDDHQSKTASGMVPPYPDTYITQYGDNADNYPFAGHENYAMRQHPNSHGNRNVESLQRHPDWLGSDAVPQQQPITSLTSNISEDRMPTTSAQAAFYSRRPSAGLTNNRSFSQTSLDPFSEGFQIRSKLNTARSTTDLQSANSNASRLPANNGLVGYDNLTSDNTVDLSANICRQHLQGYCPRGEQCPYLHTAPSAMGFSPVPPVASAAGMPGSQHHVAMAAAAGQMGPMGYAGGVPINALYQQYPNGMTFDPNAAAQSTGLVHGFGKPGPHPGNLGNMRYQHQPGNLGHHKSDNNMYSRRGSADHDQNNRFANVELKDLTGKIYELCKDQHGCRYLQKKLEEQNEENLNTIFNEVFKHFVELMTDPFGNYLCQKLLDYCNDEQRTIIVETVAKDLVGISLNMHGTRAVQKMIESLSTSRQIRMIIVALTPNVVTLIKDLNGNHVIQKCLHRLSAADNQFIYDAVSRHCVEVATHRHGCCVLQRCIDHASISQRAQLVTEVTHHALPLVQDPFGNYVVQYVLDLGDAVFSDALIRRFVGNVCKLSVQKFSSNVIEKASEVETRQLLIEEMLDKDALEKLLRDSFANYVVQTSLDYADPEQRIKLVDCIRPILPSIRNTPYGKRIQGKLQRDQQQRDPQQQGNVFKKFGNMNNRDNVQMQNLQQNNGLPVLGFPFNYGNMGMIGMNEQMYPYM